MTRRDHAVVGVLVLLLAMLAAAIAVPDLPGAPAASDRPSPSAAAAQPYREGILGHAVSVSPLTAQTTADRDLVALVFSSLVRLGPAGGFVPDLATSWSVGDEGRTWTFRLRDDVTWHDGKPVTADDVAFTIRTLQDAAYTGPTAASWRDVEVATPDERTVTFTLQTALGGFLQAATQPIAPAHLLSDVPVDQLAADPFGRHPVGSGPFRLVSLDDGAAILAPAVAAPVPATPVGSASSIPTDSLATPAPTVRPVRPVPYLPGIELRFFDDPAALRAAYLAGSLDAVSGLPPADALELAKTPGSRLLRDPGSTLTAVALNLRPTQPAFRDARVRRALLAAIDRGALIDDAFAGLASRADAPISPASWAYDVAASVPVLHDPSAAFKGLAAAGWTRLSGGWALPRATKPLTLQLLSPDLASNPSAYHAAQDVAADWAAIGFAVRHVALPPDELVAGHLRTGDFAVAVIDVNIGLDPDLYPLLASSQTTSRGSNLFGLQDPALDKLMSAARGPGTRDERRADYAALQKRLADRQYLLPLAFRDLVVVVSDRVEGPSSRQVDDPGDRFWDVLTWRLAGGR